MACSHGVNLCVLAPSHMFCFGFPDELSMEKTPNIQDEAPTAIVKGDEDSQGVTVTPVVR